MDAEEKKKYSREYYYANKERMDEQHKAYMDAHRDEQRQKRRERYAANREQEIQQVMAYKTSHRGKVNKTQQKYNDVHREEVNQKRREYATRHREYLNWRQRAYNATHREQSKANYLKRYYDLSLVEWNALYEKQDGCCAICKQPFETIHKLKVDHCHTTGKVRGLLCSNCNSGMGLLKDDINTLQAAIEYLTLNKLE